MEIEYDMTVKDKNGKTVGTIDHIVNDAWSGEARKFMVRLDEEADAVFFTPEHVAQVTEKGVTLTVPQEELEHT